MLFPVLIIKSANDRNGQTKSNGRGNGLSSEGKKKRSEDATETVLKKPKHENSTVSSTKVGQKINYSLLFFVYKKS